METTHIVFFFFLFLNVFTFLLCFYDKRCAVNHRYRVSENVFFILSLLGGAVGFSFGMYLFHHKTKKITFKIGIPLIILFQILLLFLCYNK